jgi:hypothetical protein
MAIKDNLLEIEVVYSKINKALDENISRLNTGATAVENYNKKISVVPSEFQKSLTEIKTKTDAVTQSSEKARLAEIKLQQAREKAFDKYEQSLLKQEQLSEKQAQKQINESNRIIAQKEKEFAKFEKEFNKYEADLAKQAIAEQNARKKQVQSILDQSKSLQSLNKQRESSIKQLEREQAKLKASENLYNKVQAKMNALSNEYKNLATKKELGLKLTDVEQKKYLSLQKSILTYDKTLKAVDSTMGKHQRNVGNYASGFNPISNSINQLTREMPAFTYSAQTGFMALSNNIPIFTDAIGNAVRQNKELIAQGQPVKSVLRQVAGAFLSWQTLMGVGITLLTVYGKEIGEFIAGTESKKKAIEEEKKAIEEKQQAEERARETTAKYQTDEISRSKILLETAKNVSLSYSVRIKAIKELKERYPEYLGNLSDEKILAGDTAEAEMKLNNALMSRGLALAVQDKFNENLQKELELTLQYADANEKALKIRQESLSLAKDNQMTINRSVETAKIEKENKEILKQADLYKEKVFALREERATLLDLYNANAKNLNSVNDTNNATKKLTDSKEKQNEIFKIGTEKWIKEQISVLEELRSTNDTTTESYNVSTKAIEFYNQWLERLKGTTKQVKEETEGVSISLKDLADDTAQVEGEFAELNALTYFDDFKNSFIDSFKDNSGFGKLFDLLATDLEKFKGDAKATALAVSDAFQEAFNTIANANQQNFDLEYNLNEQRYQNALAFANGNAEAEEELAREKERREKEIAKREAQARKKLALFNITIDGAQALVAAAPNPFLMALVGALTVAQLALVSSQQIPEFWKGTENAPEGWAKTDERGAEIHTDSKGNIKDLGSNKGTRVKYLSKGDKIINAQKTKELLSLSSFNKEYNDMLFRNQILPPIIMNNSNNIDLSGVESKLDKLVNKSEVTIVDDENGRRYFEKTQNSKMELKNSRIFIKSRNVRA